MQKQSQAEQLAAEADNPSLSMPAFTSQDTDKRDEPLDLEGCLLQIMDKNHGRDVLLIQFGLTHLQRII